jgi:hypothetical protein
VYGTGLFSITGYDDIFSTDRVIEYICLKISQ